MPDTQKSTPPDSAGFANRAARRQRTKGRGALSTTGSGAAGKARDTGRHDVAQGPRHWSVRRSG